MTLLLLSATFFLFLSLTAGFSLNKVLFKSEFSFFNCLITGTAAITVYLNILSLFLTTDYKLLIPPLMLSVYVVAKTPIMQLLRNSISANVSLLLSRRHLIVTIAFILPLLLFIFVPPYNADSSGYHILSILWNEKYKVVPGLANLFQQYGYNSSFFVLSAAFSFTDVFHQSLYPINGVLVVCFFLWMVKKACVYDDVRRVIVWLLLLIFLRQFPINLSSPSADALASILVFYIFFEALEEAGKPLDVRKWKRLLLLASFAIIIKLSTVPLLLIAVVPLVVYRKDAAAIFRMYFRVLPVALLIVIPWLARNVVLSGYLIFPFPSINLFSFDWKVPLDVTVAERLHISHAPRLISDDFAYVDTLSFVQWFPVWLQKLWSMNRVNFILAAASILFTPLAAIVMVLKKKISSFYLCTWVVAYICLLFWLVTSPDIRFGYHYMLPCLFIPLFAINTHRPVNVNRWMYKLSLPVIGIASLYYTYLALQMLQPYPLSRWLFRPLKSPEYYRRNDLSTFKYVMLNNGVKLYIYDDSAHHTINAPLPSCSPYREGIRMRGDKIEDGFRIDQ